MKEAIPGNSIPKKNQIQGLLPIRLANIAVIIGILNKTNKPIEKNSAAPIYYLAIISLLFTTPSLLVMFTL